MSEDRPIVQIIESPTIIEVSESAPNIIEIPQTIVEVTDAPDVQVKLNITNQPAQIIEVNDVQELVQVGGDQVTVVQVASVGLPGPPGPPGSDISDGELHLTPKVGSTGAEGTVFYASGDDHLYVATE